MISRTVRPGGTRERCMRRGEWSPSADLGIGQAVPLKKSGVLGASWWAPESSMEASVVGRWLVGWVVRPGIGWEEGIAEASVYNGSPASWHGLFFRQDF